MYSLLLGPTTLSKYFAKPSVHRAFGSRLDLPLWNLIEWSSSWIFSCGRRNKTFVQHLTDTFGPAPATRTETHFKHHKVLVPNIVVAKCRVAQFMSSMFYSTLRSKGEHTGLRCDEIQHGALCYCSVAYSDACCTTKVTHIDILVTLGWVRQCMSLYDGAADDAQQASAPVGTNPHRHTKSFTTRWKNSPRTDTDMFILL